MALARGSGSPHAASASSQLHLWMANNMGSLSECIHQPDCSYCYQSHAQASQETTMQQAQLVSRQHSTAVDNPVINTACLQMGFRRVAGAMTAWQYDVVTQYSPGA